LHKRIINIGLVAHVDAGKTTLTENMLFKAGAIRSKGSVDEGSTITDSLEIERKRGISVKATAASFIWKNTQINLIDTPGHVDFTAEVERSLSILEGAILVVSAVEGVQAHTYSIFEALKSMNIPTLIVVNKLDRQGADYFNVLEELTVELGAKIFPLNYVYNEGLKNVNISDVWSNVDELSDIKNLGLENLAELDEQILEMYLDGEELSWNAISNAVIENVQKNNLVPVLATIAKNDIGTAALLNAITKFFPSAASPLNAENSALVYKIEHDKTLGRIAHIKLFAGSLTGRNIISNTTQGTEDKIAQLRKLYSNKLESIAELFAGDVGVISGLPNVQAGDILGNPAFVPKATIIQHPIITVQVIAKKPEQYAQLADALMILNAEDPTLSFKWYKGEQELHLKLMGNIQMEILQSLIASRFGIDSDFMDPTVIYKETPSAKAEGYAKYTMPKPCWAIVKFIIEPGQPGSGITYKSEVSVDKIDRKYQNEVEGVVSKALEQGHKGWEVTDVIITLIDGEDHEMHSRPGDFILATPMGIMDGLQNAGTTLLEPLYSFEIKASEELLGQIASDLTTMRATFANPNFEGDKFILKGIVPVATSIDYSIKLSSITGGKGKIKLSYGGYQKCSDELGKVREYKGVNPLDRSQWILQKRGAFKADERKF